MNQFGSDVIVVHIPVALPPGATESGQVATTFG